MATRKGLVLIYMGMECIWESVISDLDMVKVYICSKMALAMKATGLRVSEKDGASINMLMAPDTQENIKLALERVLVCINTSPRRDTKETGKETKRMAMESLSSKMAKWKLVFIRIMLTLAKLSVRFNEDDSFLIFNKSN